MRVVQEGQGVMVSTKEGVIVRTPVDGISRLGRPAQGVKVMDVAQGDCVVALAVSAESADDDSPDEEEEL